jgi:alpha-L-rhamnosidase
MIIKDRWFLDPPSLTCHSSTLEFFKGKTIFSWFGGIREGDSSSCIYIKGLSKKTICIGDKDSIPRWNPILMAYNDRLYIWVKSGLFCDRWQTFLYDITEWDHLTTRKEKEDCMQIIPAGLNGPVKTKPLIIDDKIICGSSFETIYDWTSYIEVYSISHGTIRFKDRSRPLSIPKTTYANPISGLQKISSGIIQPSLWFSSGTTHALFRSCHGSKSAYYAFDDNGVWSDPVEINLKNPNSSLDVVEVDGILYIAYNDSSYKRSPLVVGKFKLNDGELEKIDEIVINEIAESHISNELSYPFMRLNGEEIHLSYTYGRVNIEYCIISDL